MSDKSFSDKKKQDIEAATVLRPNPADFPLGSLESRAAARIMHQEMSRNAGEQERRKQVDSSCAAWIISHKQGPIYWLRN